jgi:pyridoxal phosphate enzyme (YggS family)
MKMKAIADERVKEFLAARLAATETKIAAACSRVGRDRSEITLVAVTKTVSAPVAAALHDLGVADLGESRPQELWKKAELLPGTVRWHLVGHLQRNKIERTLPCVSLIHSVDSLRLLEALDREAGKLGHAASVLLEVNASGEANKHGFAANELPSLVSALSSFQSLRVMGLMTMAALTPNPEESRPTFRLLNELRERLRSQFASPHKFDNLSMGMTNDFEIAIEEGATLVRIGTAFFEGLPEAET